MDLRPAHEAVQPSHPVAGAVRTPSSIKTMVSAALKASRHCALLSPPARPGTDPAPPGSPNPTSANKARTAVRSITAAPNIGQRAASTLSCRSGISTGDPLTAACRHAPSLRVNCRSSNSSAVGSLAYNVSCATLVVSTEIARWPSFVAAVAERGAFRSVHALPLRLRRQAVGALNLFHREPGALRAADLALGQALADVATIGILSERAIRRSEMLNEQLQTALNSRVVIEHAKGCAGPPCRLGHG